jgi:hypothetical protein
VVWHMQNSYSAGKLINHKLLSHRLISKIRGAIVCTSDFLHILT